MRVASPGLSVRGVVLASVAALALGGGACGHGDADGRSDPPSAVSSDDDQRASASGTAASSGSDEQQIRALLDRMGTAMENGDGRTVCSGYTPAARKEIVTALKSLDAPGAARGSTCAQIYGGVLRRGALIEDPDPKILSVKVDGDKASVTADVSHDKEDQTAELVKADGRWKVAVWFQN